LKHFFHWTGGLGTLLIVFEKQTNNIPNPPDPLFPSYFQSGD
jgi:hypothetical protein